MQRDTIQTFPTIPGVCSQQASTHMSDNALPIHFDHDACRLPSISPSAVQVAFLGATPSCRLVCLWTTSLILSKAGPSSTRRRSLGLTSNSRSTASSTIQGYAWTTLIVLCSCSCRLRPHVTSQRLHRTQARGCLGSAYLSNLVS